MASSLLRSYNLARSDRSAFVHWRRLLSSDSLVEFKPAEIGIVSGIPENHLRRRVCISNFQVIYFVALCLVLFQINWTKFFYSRSSVVWLIFKGRTKYNCQVRDTSTISNQV